MNRRYRRTFTRHDYKSIFDSDYTRLHGEGKPAFIPLRCILFNNDSDDIDEVYMVRREKKPRSCRRQTHAHHRSKETAAFHLTRGHNEGKEKRFVIYVPGKLSPPPVTNCRTKQKRKKSYLVKIQLAVHAIRSPL